MKPSLPPSGSRAAARFGVLAVCLLAAGAGLAQAAPPTQVWQAVSDRTLDRQRGGFSFGGGLEVSFGITRSVFINGQLITETVLNIARMTDITPAWAARLREELQSLTLVQNGPGNTFVSGAAPTSGPAATAAPTTTRGATGVAAPTATASSFTGTATGTVIQNTLNNQQILHQTIINASSNSLGMLRLASLHSSLSEAIRQSVGQR